MRPLIVIRRVPQIDFMRWHLFGFAFSVLLSVATVVMFLTAGLNYGIDFVGGTLIEARSTTGPANLADMRAKLDALQKKLEDANNKATTIQSAPPPVVVYPPYHPYYYRPWWGW